MSSFQDDPVRNLPLVTPPRDGAQKRAASWQIAITFVAAAVIVTVFLWGINNQRIEGGSEQTAATQPTPATPHGANPGSPPAQAKNQEQKPTTTGQGPDDKDNHSPQQNSGRESGTQPAQKQKPDAGGGSQPSQAAGKNN